MMLVAMKQSYATRLVIPVVLVVTYHDTCKSHQENKYREREIISGAPTIL